MGAPGPDVQGIQSLSQKAQRIEGPTTVVLVLEIRDILPVDLTHLGTVQDEGPEGDGLNEDIHLRPLQGIDDPAQLICRDRGLMGKESPAASVAVEEDSGVERVSRWYLGRFAGRVDLGTGQAGQQWEQEQNGPHRQA